MGEKQYWLTPAGLYETLDREFGFDMDPFPNPLPPAHDALLVPWGKVNFVNPPFNGSAEKHGRGTTAFIKKTIVESDRGNTSVILLPIRPYLNLLLEAGAEFRSAGYVRWLDTKTKEKGHPRPTVCAVLRGYRP